MSTDQIHPPVGTVAACRRYPVKSLQGLDVPSIEIDPKGVDGDRSFGIVEVASGRLLAAKRTAALLGAYADDDHITLPDGSSVRLHDPGVHAVLSTWLGREVRLVAAPDAGAVSYEMTFDPPNEDADVFEIPVPEGTLLDITAVHAITTATLGACATARPDLDWDIRRFRPNLLLDVDVDPWEEQSWIGREVAMGSALLRVSGPMVRCAMPLRAQPGGLERQPGLFQALNDLNEAFPNHLGLCLDVIEPGRIEVGDTVLVA